MTDVDEPALPVAVEPPSEAMLEVARLKRSVRAQVFGTAVEPTRIGRFRLLECIGRGGMGVVWSAMDDELDRTVAIKLLRPEYSGRDVTAEARALARLSHPNVVAVFDVGEHEGQRFIAMEYVRGATLRAWLQTPRSLEAQIAQFVQAGRGLSAAHSVGLVHRDFKPDNVLVGHDGRPRVLDFGLARAPTPTQAPVPAIDADADPFSTTMTHAGLLIGTPAYMAPEQHLGEPADARCDQFAFAVALFEGLVGRLPFASTDLRTLSLNVVRGRWEPPPPGSMPDGVRRALERALSVDPGERFDTLDQLLTALESAVSTEDPRFDTQGIDAVLARAAELGAAAPAQTGLTSGDLEEVAREAGLDPAHARQAANEALAARTPVSPQPALVASQPPADLNNSVTVTVRIPRIGAGVVDVLLKEMERREGKGQTAPLGASTTWQNKTLELHLDPTAHDTRLSLTRKLGILTRTRTPRYAALGIMLGVSTLVPLLVELLGDYEGIVVFFIFGTMALGAWLGSRVAQARSLSEERRVRASLEATADRLHVLCEANSHIQRSPG